MRKLISTTILIVVAIALSACTPDEVLIFHAATGYGPTTASEADTICNESFGVGSGEDGGVCRQVATNIVMQAMAASDAGSYQYFANCRDAVDYIFAGRWDLERARYVVRRESNNNPNAVSRTGAKGCGQLTSGIRKTFLGGPWSDPYWNVLAIRKTVDDPAWGWCHWDIVNYCRSGGQF